MNDSANILLVEDDLNLGYVIKDNLNLLIAVIGLLVLLGYYIPVWLHFGKDPEEGVIVARYGPPAGYSPASLRYIQQMYYDDKVMTAAVVNLAVKGYLRINASEGPFSSMLFRMSSGLKVFSPFLA